MIAADQEEAKITDPESKSPRDYRALQRSTGQNLIPESPKLIPENLHQQNPPNTIVITKRLLESLAKHRPKSDSRISKTHSRKSSSRKSSRHRKNRESGKSASRKPGFSTPTFYRNNPATNSRKSLPRFPSPDISENTRNSESDISHGF